jgi:hypothetical protein
MAGLSSPEIRGSELARASPFMVAILRARKRPRVPGRLASSFALLFLGTASPRSPSPGRRNGLEKGAGASRALALHVQKLLGGAEKQKKRSIGAVDRPRRRPARPRLFAKRCSLERGAHSRRALDSPPTAPLPRTPDSTRPAGVDDHGRRGRSRDPRIELAPARR